MKAADARVLLTGASGGIGQAVARALTAAGAARDAGGPRRAATPRGAGARTPCRALAGSAPT